MVAIPLSVNISVNISGQGGDTAPAAMTTDQWFISPAGTTGVATIEIKHPPSDGGQPITDYVYTNDDGQSWFSLGGNVPGFYSAPGYTDNQPTPTQVAAVNSIDQAPPSDVKNVTTVPAGSAAITLTIKRGPIATQMAPEGIQFSISATGFDVGAPSGGDIFDERLHEISYKVVFGDPGLHSVLDEIPIEWQSSNEAFAPIGTHVFKNPGTYMITAVAIDKSGNIATDSVQITVPDPAAIITGNQNIVVAADNDFSGAPTGQQFTSFDAAWSAYEGLSGQGKLWLKRGEHYNVTDKVVRTGNSFRVSTWGTGDKPVLENTVPSTKSLWLRKQYLGVDFVLEGVRLKGGYDELPNDATGTAGLVWQEGLRVDNPIWSVISDCEVSGFNQPVYLIDSVRDVFFNNIEISEVGSGIGIFASGALDAVVGCTGFKAYRGPLADGWYNGKSVCANQHGPGIRHACKDWFMSGMHIASKSAWPPANVGIDQPCIRDNTTNNPNNTYAWYERGVLENGGPVFQSRNAEGTSGPYPVNIPGNRCLQNMFLLGGPGSTRLANIGYGGFTVRNLVAIQPDVPKNLTGGGGFEAFFSTEDLGGNPDNLNAPIRIYNVTLGQLQTDANAENKPFSVMHNTGGYTDITIENIVEFAPNRTGGDQRIGDNPLDETTLMFTPKYVGFVWWNHNGGALDTYYATPPNSAQKLSPELTSPALGDASGTYKAVYDIFGTQRPAAIDRGAWQVSV